MIRFRRMKTLEKFVSVHASGHNHFGQKRHLVSRQIYKQRRATELARGDLFRPGDAYRVQKRPPNHVWEPLEV
jgi:hypothetical protein